MNKVLAFTYSFLILIQSFNINLEDFSKISALVEHAQYHKEKYGDTFLEFLVEHYGDDREEHENSHTEHEDLPFNDSHHMCSHINTSFLSVVNTFDFKYQEYIEIPVNFYYKDMFTAFEKTSVFQPPKHV